MDHPTNAPTLGQAELAEKLWKYVIFSDEPLSLAETPSVHMTGQVIKHIPKRIGTTHRPPIIGKFVTISSKLPQIAGKKPGIVIARVVHRTAQDATTNRRFGKYIIISDWQAGNLHVGEDASTAAGEEHNKLKRKYVTLSSTLPRKSTAGGGIVIGKIVDLSPYKRLKSFLTPNDVVMVVNAAEKSMSEDIKPANLDFLASASPSLDIYLDKCAKAIEAGDLKTFSNSDDRAFMSKMVEGLETIIADQKSKKGPPRPQ
jgi:hypothetical protein